MRKRDEWKSALKADPTDWLLEDDNPAVRYWALRDLVGASKRETAAARRRVLSSPVVEEVFRQQRPEGHWEKPDNMHAPHFLATIFQLSLLGDLGLTAADERVSRGVEAVLRTQRRDGGFPGHNPDRCASGPFDIGLIIRFMHQFGLGDDRRVKRMYGWIEKNQRPDGGWSGAGPKCDPSPSGCFYASANVLWGLATAGDFAGTSVAAKGLRFLSDGVASFPRQQRPFGYPQFCNVCTDDVQLCEIYLGLGMRADESLVRRCVRTILLRQRTDGRWVERYGPYPGPKRNPRFARLREVFPKKGQPSKWVTAKAMIALRRAAGVSRGAASRGAGRPKHG